MSRARDIADGTLNSADINGGNIDNTTIGGTNPAAGTFTTFTSTGIDDNLTSGGPALTIDPSGNVGVGETSPSTFGKVVSSGGTFSLVTDTSSQRRLSFWSTANGNSENAYIQVQNDGLTTNTGEMLFATKNSGGTLAERMRIDSSGNVGIGTNSPAGKLAVSPDNVSGTRIDGLYLRKNLNAQANYVAWQQGSIGWRLGINYNDSNYPLCLFYGSSTPTASSPGSEFMRIDSSGNLKFNSGYGSVATAYGCRAWVNFDGTGTVAIRASGNVSSITDNGTGNYTVNFTTAMPDANYSVSLNSGNSSFNSFNVTSGITNSNPTVNSVRFTSSVASTNTPIDLPLQFVAIFR